LSSFNGVTTLSSEAPFATSVPHRNRVGLVSKNTYRMHCAWATLSMSVPMLGFVGVEVVSLPGKRCLVAMALATAAVVIPVAGIT